MIHKSFPPSLRPSPRFASQFHEYQRCLAEAQTHLETMNQKPPYLFDEAKQALLEVLASPTINMPNQNSIPFTFYGYDVLEYLSQMPHHRLPLGDYYQDLSDDEKPGKHWNYIKIRPECVANTLKNHGYGIEPLPLTQVVSVLQKMTQLRFMEVQSEKRLDIPEGPQYKHLPKFHYFLTLTPLGREVVIHYKSEIEVMRLNAHRKLPT